MKLKVLLFLFFIGNTLVVLYRGYKTEVSRHYESYSSKFGAIITKAANWRGNFKTLGGFKLLKLTLNIPELLIKSEIKGVLRFK